MTTQSFSFDSTAGASQSTVKPKLEGNKIHNVKLEDCKIEDIKGVKDPDMTYKVIKFIFSNDDGQYEHAVFEPKPDDFLRGENEYTKDGKTNKIPQPSNVETMMLLFKHIIDGFVPEIAKKIDANETSLVAKSWDQLRNLVVKLVSPGKGRENKIKLIKNKKGEGIFPGYFTAVNREGKPYVKNNFIGQKVAFTAYEMDKAQKEQNASPTKMESSNFSIPQGNSAADLDLNFNMDDL